MVLLSAPLNGALLRPNAAPAQAPKSRRGAAVSTRAAPAVPTIPSEDALPVGGPGTQYGAKGACTKVGLPMRGGLLLCPHNS